MNYLLNSHKLKLIAGAEYFDMSGAVSESVPERSSVDGWSFAAGLRLYF